MAAVRFVAVVGSRTWRGDRRVSDIVGWLLKRGFGVITGGALGADTHALAAVLRVGAVGRARVILPWPVDLMPRDVRGVLRRFAARGGRVDTVLSARPGYNSAAAALRVRTELVVDAACGVVAFLHGATPGTWLTIHYAIGRGIPVVVITSSGRMPRHMPGGRWVAITSGPLAGGFRWHSRPGLTKSADDRPLSAIITVPSQTGMPAHDALTHVGSLSPGDRLWFERCEVVGDTIIAPHPNESDGRPAFLTVPAIRKRFGCEVASAVELGELFFALDADETVVADYAGEAVRWGLDAITRELFRLVVRLAEVEQADDPVEDAEPYLDNPDDANDQLPTMPSLAYHVVGSLRPEPEEPDWVARQPQPFRELLTRIETCQSLPELAELGKQIYVLPLTHEQAGVAWTWYRLRKDHLQRTLRLSPPAHTLMQQLQRVPYPALARFGAYLYHRQHNGLASLPSHEWAAIWQAYTARKAALAS